MTYPTYQAGPTDGCLTAPTPTLVLALACALLVGLVLLAMLASLAVLGYFAVQVPLTKEDLAVASWLGSPSTALHFSLGSPLGIGLTGTLVLVGVAVGLVKRSIMAPLAGALMACLFAVGTGEEAFVRMGLLDGTVRLGCYVPESRECLDMLGLDSTGAPSRYEQGEDAAWYRERIAKTTEGVPQWSISGASFPTDALMRALPYAGRVQELRDTVASQRAQVKQLRQDHAAHHSHPVASGTTKAAP